MNRKTDVKDLGVNFNTKIDFSTHIDIVTSKAYSLLGFMIRVCKDLDDIRAFKTIYCSSILPILEYCSPVWTPWYGTYIKRLESIQRNFIRFVYREVTGLTFVHYQDYLSYLDGCREYNLEHRRFISSMMFSFDLLTGRVRSEELQSRIRPTHPIRANLRNTRPDTHRI